MFSFFFFFTANVYEKKWSLKRLVTHQMRTTDLDQRKVYLPCCPPHTTIVHALLQRSLVVVCLWALSVWWWRECDRRSALEACRAWGVSAEGTSWWREGAPGFPEGDSPFRRLSGGQLPWAINVRGRADKKCARLFGLWQIIKLQLFYKFIFVRSLSYSHQAIIFCTKILLK